MKPVMSLLLGVLSFALTPLLAQSPLTPESGWWWNPDESGRGYSLEIQDNSIFFAAYVYDQDPEFTKNDTVRAPIWFVANGTLIDDDRFLGELNLAEDGQCFGCDWSPPDLIVGGGGAVEIEFHSNINATLTVNGEEIPIQRFFFNPNINNVIDVMLGRWLIGSDQLDNITFNIAPFSADTIIFDDVFEDSGFVFYEGCRPLSIDSPSCSSNDILNHKAVGFYDDDLGEHVFTVVHDGDLWRTYFVNLGTNQFIGSMDQYNNVSFDADPFFALPAKGFRTASAAFIQNGIGPASTKSNDKRGKFANEMLTKQQLSGLKRGLKTSANLSKEQRNQKRKEAKQRLYRRINATKMLAQ